VQIVRIVYEEFALICYLQCSLSKCIYMCFQASDINILLNYVSVRFGYHFNVIKNSVPRCVCIT
jgi:hypothetical protein